MLSWTRIALVALIVLAGAIAVVVGEGLTGRYDRYFNVTLTNRLEVPVTIRACKGTNCSESGGAPAVRVAPGASDLETGSSTVHIYVVIHASGGATTCVDLYFKQGPRHPLFITGTTTTPAVSGGPSCA